MCSNVIERLCQVMGTSDDTVTAYHNSTNRDFTFFICSFGFSQCTLHIV